MRYNGKAGHDMAADRKVVNLNCGNNPILSPDESNPPNQLIRSEDSKLFHLERKNTLSSLSPAVTIFNELLFLQWRINNYIISYGVVMCIPHVNAIIAVFIYCIIMNSNVS